MKGITSLAKNGGLLMETIVRLAICILAMVLLISAASSIVVVKRDQLTSAATPIQLPRATDQPTLSLSPYNLLVQGKFNEALAAFNSSLKADPNNATTFNNLGIALSGLGRYEEALQAFDKAIRLNPNFASAFYNKGIVFQALGRTADANTAFSAASRCMFKPTEVTTQGMPVMEMASNGAITPIPLPRILATGLNNPIEPRTLA